MYLENIFYLSFICDQGGKKLIAVVMMIKCSTSIFFIQNSIKIYNILVPCKV